MKIRPYQSPPPSPRKPPNDVHNGIQLGHDVSDLGKATGLITREELVEVRGLVAREGRQAALLGEHSLPHTALRAGAAGLNALLAAGAIWHGVELMRKGEKAEGASHLLLGAGCALTAGHLAGLDPALAHLGGQLLMAHGAAEIGIGGYRAARGERIGGLLQAAHGACMIGAELVPGAALPLCVAMAGLTAAQIWQHHHQPSHRQS
ncbi:MAG: hypothetical protein U0931_19545 [Vulcanimicrobiota bacterium]